MASTADTGLSTLDTGVVSETDGSHSIPHPKIQEQTDALPSSAPVEMSQLPQQQAPTYLHYDGSSAPLQPTVGGVSEAQTLPPTTTTAEKSAAPITSSTAPGLPSEPNATSAAIGPGLDHDPSASTVMLTSNNPNPSSPTLPSPQDAGPAVLITLFLLNGKRHPYKIDTKYLRKRNVFKEELEEGKEPDPFGISIYTLKELIWRDWREEWDPRPTIPGSIRLIYFGKLLEDKTLLKDLKLNATAPNIFHMSVKPQDLVDEEENAKLKGGKAGSSRSRRMGGNTDEVGETSAGCCRCSVM